MVFNDTRAKEMTITCNADGTWDPVSTCICKQFVTGAT
jgi:hypothetical protein